MFRGGAIHQVFHYRKGRGWESTLVALDAASGDELWRRGFGRIANAPTIAPDGRVVVSDFGGEVSALAPSGERLWTARCGEADLGRPCIARDRVLVAEIGGSAGFTYGLDLATGEPSWRFANGGHAYPRPSGTCCGRHVAVMEAGHDDAENRMGEHRMIRWIASIAHRRRSWSGKRRVGRAATRLAAMLLVLAPATAPAMAGTPATLGSMRFEAPDAGSGWTTKPVKGGMLYQKQFAPTEENRRKGAAIIQILGPFAGTPATLDKSFEQVATGVKGMAEERPYLKSEGLTTNGHRIRADYRCCAEMQGLSVAQRTVGIASSRNQVVLALVGLELRDAAKKQADADFEALVRSLALEGGDQPFALKPRAGDGGLDGVYTHLDTGLRPNAFGGMDFYSDSEITVFDPSGLYSTELPETGDIAAHCRAHPTDCGLYALKGGGFLSGPGEIEMREVSDAFGTIETETKPFAKQRDGLEIDGGAYSRIPPFAAGTPFEGTWRYFFASVGSTAFAANGVSSERLLTLSRDGTFRREGWAGASGSTDTGTGTVSFATKGGGQPATSGRYRVEGYALELIGDDGRTERLSIFAPDKEGDKLLVIGGSNYLKQE